MNDFLVERFPELMDIDFTASKMEDELDHIEEGKMKWIKVVKEFFTPFSSNLAEVEKTKGKIKPHDIPTDLKCEKCGLPMVIRWGRHGRFVACSGFPQCKNAKPLLAEGTEHKEQGTESIPQETGEKCEKCGSSMVIKTGRFGKFLACSQYPKCKNTKPLSTGLKCPQDGGDIVARRFKREKPFWSCGNYPTCRFTLWYKPIPYKCPQCSTEFLLEKRDRTGKLIHFCHDKKCEYKEEIKETEPSPIMIPLS